jgi:hypothetical protein
MLQFLLFFVFVFLFVFSVFIPSPILLAHACSIFFSLKYHVQIFLFLSFVFTVSAVRYSETCE